MNEKLFWNKVNKTETCWFWTGAKADGYGQLNHGKKNYKAHRVSWELVNGDIPEDKQIDHMCGIRACVNPQHLRLVSQYENLSSRNERYDSQGGKSKKSFLLYIHHPLFKEEKEKSKLVNNLLERHYYGTVDGGKSQKQIHAEIMLAQEALKNAKVPKGNRYVQTPEGIFGPTTLTPKTQKFCKNNHPIPNGRDRCLGKKCQYAH